VTRAIDGDSPASITSYRVTVRVMTIDYRYLRWISLTSFRSLWRHHHCNQQFLYELVKAESNSKAYYLSLRISSWVIAFSEKLGCCLTFLHEVQVHANEDSVFFWKRAAATTTPLTSENLSTIKSGPARWREADSGMRKPRGCPPNEHGSGLLCQYFSSPVADDSVL